MRTATLVRSFSSRIAGKGPSHYFAGGAAELLPPGFSLRSLPRAFAAEIERAERELSRSLRIDGDFTPGKYRALLEMPGIRPDQVRVHIDGLQLKVDVSTDAPVGAAADNAPTDAPADASSIAPPTPPTMHVAHYETYLPNDCVLENVTSRLKHGILAVTFDRLQHDEKKVINVPVLEEAAL